MTKKELEFMQKQAKLIEDLRNKNAEIEEQLKKQQALNETQKFEIEYLKQEVLINIICLQFTKFCNFLIVISNPCF